MVIKEYAGPMTIITCAGYKSLRAELWLLDHDKINSCDFDQYKGLQVKLHAPDVALDTNCDLI